MSTVRDIQAKIFDKINPAIKFSVTRYVMAIGIFIALFVFGLFSTASLGVDLLPNINIPVVLITTNYTGAQPSVVDQQVTKIIENTVSTLSGITEISSSSSTGVSQVVLSFDASVDKNNAANQVSALVAAAVRKLPTNASAPVVRTFDPNANAIIEFGLSAVGTDLSSVSDYITNTLTPELQRLDGVANITITGAPTREFDVLLNPQKLQFFNINPQQVTSAIAASSLNQPIGNIITNNNSVTFTTSTQPSTVKEISRIVVDTNRGISVGDLAAVRDKPAATSIARVNGQPVILVSIQKTQDSNTVAVAKNVKKYLSKVRLPSGYMVTMSNDTTGPIRASVEATYHELFMTALVVAIICLLFLGKLNTAISVIVAIPISLSAGPTLYNLMGFSFNLVSLLALITAIGIVVDDSIVVAENVERYRAMGYSLKESVLKGGSEVFSAVVAASLSILSVLLPICFLPGTIGKYLQQFPMGLAAAVVLSFFEAILFLTVRMAYTPDSKEFDWRDFLESWGMLGFSFKWGFKAWKRPLGILVGLAIGVILLVTQHVLFLPGLVLYPVALSLVYYLGRIVITLLQALTMTLHGVTEAGLEWVRDRYAGSLRTVLKLRVWILIGAGVFFLGTLLLVFSVLKIPFTFVPQTDGGIMLVTLRMPTGTSAATTNEMASRLERYLMNQKEVTTVQATISGTGTSTQLQATEAKITLQLVPVEERKNVNDLIPQYRSVMMKMIADQPSARLSVAAGGGPQGGASSVGLNLVSADFNLLKSRNSMVINAIQNNPYVTDVNSTLSDVSIQYNFTPDPARLKGIGISPDVIATALQIYDSGVNPANVLIGGLSYPIQVFVDPTKLSGAQSLLNFPVYSSLLGTPVQVSQLGTFTMDEAPLTVSRYNRQYVAQLTVNLKPNAPPALAFQNQLTKELEEQKLLDNGVSLSSNSRNSMASLASQLATSLPIAFFMSFFLAYLVMGAQFNSWRYPLYLLLPVPLALLGALWFVYFGGAGFDIFAMLGMLMLIGLSAKNAILYLDFVVERLDHMPIVDALVESARLRFRPIIMTTMTVLVISFPLVLSNGQGSEYGRQLGVVILGGIISSAILTFFVVPAAFYMFEKKHHPDSRIVPFGEVAPPEQPEVFLEPPPSKHRAKAQLEDQSVRTLPETTPEGDDPPDEKKEGWEPYKPS